MRLLIPLLFLAVLLAGWVAGLVKETTPDESFKKIKGKINAFFLFSFFFIIIHKITVFIFTKTTHRLPE